MAERASPEVLAALREALENQIAASDPPEVDLARTRLLDEGYSEEVVWRLLSAALLQEMSLILRFERSFDRAGYVDALNALPELLERAT